MGLSLNPSIHKPCGHWHKQKFAKYTSFPSGRYIAAKDQPGTPNIYVYDIGYMAVVKFDTSFDDCPAVDRLVVNEAGWSLGWNRQYGADTYAMSQRGGCCMSKNGNRLWYLFEGTGDNDGDCKMVEVDISEDTMSIVNTTVFEDLIATDTIINDGCTDDTYTFWCTNEKIGRIIKIRNLDHSLIENHEFGYPTDNHDESIHSLDVHKSSSKLYWSHFESTGTIAAYHTMADLDFNVEDTAVVTGFAAFQNWVRVFGSDIYFDRVYYTISGYLRRRNRYFTVDIGSTYLSPYNHNILNVKDGFVFTIHGDGSVSNNTHISKIKQSDMTLSDRLEITYYSGGGYLTSYAWKQSACSAMNYQTGKIMIFRYEEKDYNGGLQDVNRAAIFDEDLNLLNDVCYNIRLINPNYNIRDDEPVVWPM